MYASEEPPSVVLLLSPRGPAATTSRKLRQVSALVCDALNVWSLAAIAAAGGRRLRFGGRKESADSEHLSLAVSRFPRPVSFTFSYLSCSRVCSVFVLCVWLTRRLFFIDTAEDGTAPLHQ